MTRGSVVFPLTEPVGGEKVPDDGKERRTIRGVLVKSK